ncbi:MAG: hypothetical protein IT208_01180 [Chthonomonadales bacterium]|nr:hypothetical protein [Chthonomonadales bacterium]
MPRHLALLAAATLALTPAAFAAAPPDLHIEAAPDGTGAVLRRGGVALNEPAARPLFTVMYSDAPDMWQARSWREVTPGALTARSDGSTATVEAASFGGLPVRLRATARAETRRGEVRWAVTLRNEAPGTVVGLRGPALRGVRDLQGGTLYLPDRPGQRLTDPWSALAREPSTLTYPVPASMQFVTFAGAGGGVAYHVLDRDMTFKHFVLGGPDRQIDVLQFPFVAPGGRWRSPPIVWQALEGDWHAAADRYGQWFRSWAPAPRISPQIRAMPFVSAVVIRARPVEDAHLEDVQKRQELGTYAGALPRMRQLKGVGYDGVQLVGWFGRGHDTTYPDHRPSAEMGGETGLRALVDAMHGMGLLASFYLNARLANHDSPTLAAHPEWETVMSGGQRWRETYGDQSFALLCPAAPGFREHMLEEVLRVENVYGGQGVQLDQVGAASSVLCFNRGHGHRTPATAWGEGYPRMLADIRREARRADPLFWTWVEGAWEGAGPYIDMSQGGFWGAIPGAQPFPQLYRYTLPIHPLFGDARMGGVPYWCPTDLARNRRIYAAAAPLFWSMRFMDDIGLSAEPAAEVHWFRDRSRALLTAHSPAASERALTLRLDTTALGRRTPPRRARALAAGNDAPARVVDGALEVSVTVPAGQVEAVLLEW